MMRLVPVVELNNGWKMVSEIDGGFEFWEPTIVAGSMGASDICTYTTPIVQFDYVNGNIVFPFKDKILDAELLHYIDCNADIRFTTSGGLVPLTGAERHVYPTVNGKGHVYIDDGMKEIRVVPIPM